MWRTAPHGFPNCCTEWRTRPTGPPGFFKDHPCEVFGEHVWATPFWEDDIDGLVGRVRVDRLLLGSDWPHAEGVVRPTDFVTDTLRGLAGDQVRRISRDNALELLGLTARR